MVLYGTRQFGSKHSLCRITHTSRRSREEGFKAQGVWCTFDGHFTKELAEREVPAWRRFYALRQLLCDSNVALKYRCAVQDRMLRNMNYVPRLPEESAETHDKMGKATAQLQGKTQFSFASFFRGAVTLHVSR